MITNLLEMPIENLEAIFKFSDIKKNPDAYLINSQIGTILRNLIQCIDFQEIKDKEFPLIKNYRNVKILKINFFESVENIKSLIDQFLGIHTLKVYRSNIAEEEIKKKISEIRNIQSLCLTDCSIENKDFFYFPLIKISTLKLKFCQNLTDDGIAYIAHMSSLTHLDLSYTSISILSSLTTLTALKILKLKGCIDLKDNEMNNLQSLNNLTQLDLTQMYNLTDEKMPYITNIPNLVRLNLELCTSISDNGILCLSQLENLSHLDLSSCKVTEEGINKLVQLRSSLNVIKVEWYNSEAL